MEERTISSKMAKVLYIFSVLNTNFSDDIYDSLIEYFTNLYIGLHGFFDNDRVPKEIFLSAINGFLEAREAIDDEEWKQCKIGIISQLDSCASELDVAESILFTEPFKGNE